MTAPQFPGQVPDDDAPPGPVVTNYRSYAEEAAERAAARAERQLVPRYPGVSRMAQFMRGEITVDDLDDEELIRGRFRAINGGWAGSAPEMIPREFHDEVQRRILSRGAEKMRTDFFEALDTVSSIMKDTMVDPQIRLRAATLLIERVAGKTPDKVELSVAIKPYEKIIAGIYTPIEDLDTIDAEVVDDDDET